MIEGIKTLLGDALTEQVEAALKGKGKDGKDIELVIGNDGSYVPAEKFNGANSGKLSAENALKSAAEALKAIGGSGDAGKIAEDVKTLQNTMTQLQQKHEQELKNISKNAALRLSLNGKVHEPGDIMNLLDMEQIEVDERGELVTDLESLLKPIRTSKGYLFKEEKPASPDITGAKPATPGTPPTPAAKADGPVVL